MLMKLTERFLDLKNDEKHCTRKRDVATHIEVSQVKHNQMNESLNLTYQKIVSIKL